MRQSDTTTYNNEVNITCVMLLKGKRNDSISVMWIVVLSNTCQNFVNNQIPNVLIVL